MELRARQQGAEHDYLSQAETFRSIPSSHLGAIISLNYTKSFPLDDLQVQNAVQRLQKIFGARAAVSEKLESSLRDLARTGDVAAAKAVRKTADASLKETAKELKAAYDSLPASSRSTVLAKV